MATSVAASVSTSQVLEVDGVSVWLAGRQILDEVRFSIGPGELVGLIGSNGAGKTTLLRVILGLQPTTSGRVRVGGVIAAGAGDARGGRDHPARTGRGLVGYVPQKIQLDPDMPVRARDLVGLGLDGNRLGIPLPSRRRRQLVDDMLEAVDASRFAGQRVGNLSGGEQQRIMIAHALISRPPLLLLDEPLANLDIRAAQEVIALLAKIAREQRVSVLISAHEMNPLLPVMDRVVYLAGGRAASGTTDEVIREDVLSKLYGHHVDVLNVHGRLLVVGHAGEGFEILSGDETAAAPGHPGHSGAGLQQ
jgi:zinc/manganese transport system ATP-binding protein